VKHKKVVNCGVAWFSGFKKESSIVVQKQRSVGFGFLNKIKRKGFGA